MCANGTARDGLMRGVAEERLLGSVRAVDIEDLFRLCLAVRLSSRGFISAGSLDILRNVRAK